MAVLDRRSLVWRPRLRWRAEIWHQMLLFRFRLTDNGGMFNIAVRFYNYSAMNADHPFAFVGLRTGLTHPFALVGDGAAIAAKFACHIGSSDFDFSNGGKQ